MKKIVYIVMLVLVLIVGVLVLTGCEGESMQNIVVNDVVIPDMQIVGGWETVLTDVKVNMDEEVTKIFSEASSNYTSTKLEPIALLGSQVVAGTNRMFLSKDISSYKIVIVYTDLQNKSEITKVTDFDFSKYTNENIEGNSDVLAGGWTVTLPTEGAKLDTDVQAVFDNATSTITGVAYYPIALLGKQPVAGTNYAILCFGAPSYGEQERGTINLVTIYEDLAGKCEITSQAYINLADYNK